MQLLFFLAQYADGIGNTVVRAGDRVRVIGGDGTKAVYKKASQYTSGYRWGCVANCTQYDNDDSLFLPPVMGSAGGGYWGAGNSYDYNFGPQNYIPQYELFHVYAYQGDVFLGEYSEWILVGYIYVGNDAPPEPFPSGPMQQ